LSENALALLAKIKSKSLNQKVCRWSHDTLRKKGEALWERVGNGKEWVPQGMRHTFCSCWLAKHEDVNKLLLMSGHTSPQNAVEALLQNIRKG
jgi:integrase